MNIVLFEKPLLPGYIYPCSLEDIRQRLTQLPKYDLAYLSAVGLTASTHKNHAVYGRYFSDPKSVVHICSISDTLTYKQPSNIKRSHIERDLADAIQFGMRIEQVGSRWVCSWEKENLKNFILDHVLLHEIGHHVYYQARKQQGLENNTSFRVREQFAEDYALRHRIM